MFLHAFVVKWAPVYAGPGVLNHLTRVLSFREHMSNFCIEAAPLYDLAPNLKRRPISLSRSLTSLKEFSVHSHNEERLSSKTTEGDLWALAHIDLHFSFSGLS